jgi:hypothetical protein
MAGGFIVTGAPHVGSRVLVHEQTAQHIMQQCVIVDTTDCAVLSKAEGVV